TYVHQLGQRDTYDPVFSYHLPVEAVREALERQGSILKTVAIPYALDEDGKRTLRSILPAGIPPEIQDALLSGMLCREYLFFVRK
ncbi:MAG: hypothetical protein HFG00_11565, partial [Oscillibacter sp.]|nr:hypothetical protein [Oscillibacter sp.]